MLILRYIYEKGFLLHDDTQVSALCCLTTIWSEISDQPDDVLSVQE